MSISFSTSGLLNNTNQNNELQNLHERILGLNEQYNERKRQWMKIKYNLIEIVNDVAGSNVRRQQLKVALKRQQLQNSQVDQEFKIVFNKQYLQNVLPTKVFIQQKLHTQSQLYNNNIIETTMTNSFASNDTVRLQILRQKQQNQLIQKQLQMLQKQYTHLNQHNKLSNSNKSKQYTNVEDSKQKQVQKQQQYDFEQDNTQDGNFYKQISKQQDSFINDKELESQIKCLKKLIENRQNTINELKVGNNEIGGRMGYLRASQNLLKKKKTLLQIKQRQLNKSVQTVFGDRQYCESSIKEQQCLKINVNDQKQQYDSRTNTIQETIEQVKQISNLISQQLSKQINQQKINELKQTFNRTQ